MKMNISIMTWINRFLMIPFLILLLLGIVEKDFLALALLLAFVIGVYQVFSFFLTLFYLKEIDKYKRVLMLYYFGVTALYFVVLYIFLNFFEPKMEAFIVRFTYCSLPILLSIFWTYILESLKKEI